MCGRKKTKCKSSGRLVVVFNPKWFYAVERNLRLKPSIEQATKQAHVKNLIDLQLRKGSNLRSYFFRHCE
jgi:hypothetical protein